MRIPRTHFISARPSTSGLRTVGSLAAASALVFGLTACTDGSDDDPAATTGATAGDVADTQDAADPAGSLIFADGWVRTTIDEDATAVFGTLVNNSDADIRVVGGENDLAGLVELHEVVDDGAGGMTMQEKDDGFVVPSGGTHELTPGGDHLMLMELTDPIGTGQEVVIRLALDDGTTEEITAYGRAFEGGDEDYNEMDHGTDHGDTGHGGMDHGDGAGHGDSDE